jgi:molecular chaperone DnaJ
LVREEPHSLFRREGVHLVCTVPLSFADAALGTKVEVPTVHGTTAKVTIPPGTQSGEVLRVRRQGLPHPDGGRPGDLLIQTLVETPRKLSTDTRKLFEELRKAEPESEAAQPARNGFFERIKAYFQGDKKSR